MINIKKYRLTALIGFLLLMILSIVISVFKTQAKNFFLAIGNPILMTFFPKSASSISGTLAAYVDSHFIITPVNLLIGIVVFASLCALFLYRPKNITKKKFLSILTIIIFIGTIIRLLLAFNLYGNYDMQSFEIVTGIVAKGGNVYNETSRYNYSPIWFNVLSGLKSINNLVPSLPFHFIVRGFLTIVDLLTALLLLKIAKKEKASYAVQLLIATLFYLNPISFMLTGYHGQFENVSIFFIVLATYIYTVHLNHDVKRANKTIYKALCWAFLTLALIVKHSFFIETIIGLKNIFKKLWTWVILFGISSLLFLLSFTPYWSVGKEGIINNVFRYSSGVGIYGITHYINLPLLKYLFIAGLFIYPFFIRSKDFATQLLSGLLFFVTFTTGFGEQYFVMPLALGALRYSEWFLWYTCAVIIMILGGSGNVALFGYNLIMRDVVWVVALMWFIDINRNSKQQFYKQKI